MKVRTLPIISLILASSTVQAQYGLEPMMNPMTYMSPAVMGMMMNPNTMMAPMNTMAPMMAAPMTYMNASTMMAPPIGTMKPAIIIDPATVTMMMNMMAPMISAAMRAMSQQAAVPPYGIPAYGMPATPAQGRYMPFFPTIPMPQQATSSKAPAPTMFDPSAWIKMFPNSIPPANAASASGAEPGAAAPVPAPKQVKRSHHHRHHAKKGKSDKPAEGK
jgi:hypothetical protein